MKDILMIVYEALISNAYIHDMTYNSDSEEYRIKFMSNPKQLINQVHLSHFGPLMYRMRPITVVIKSFRLSI